MFHREQVITSPFTHPGTVRTGSWYRHGASEAVCKEDTFLEACMINEPRDHSAPRTPYEPVSPRPAFSYHEYHYAQPFGYPPTGGHDMSSRRHSRHLINENDRQEVLSEVTDTQKSVNFDKPKKSHQPRRREHLRPQVEQLLADSLVPRKPRGSHEKHVRFLDETSHDRTPQRERVVVSKHRQDYPNADSHYDSSPSRTPPSHLHHTGGRPIASLPHASDMGEGKQHMSLKGAHHVPVPPKAPMIPRLPSPDFEMLAPNKHDVSGHQFCACCNSDIKKMEYGHQGGAKAKMDRRLREAKAHIAHMNSLSR
ncbi:hypothetical protein F4779DRAFT_607084 [Xylariaceae sp. FL0662B]|nr:hypothetical protein F4779DRAFT_607084 [Xylariaceae sp. FL0662B]